jgi:hypothetical protein
MAGLVVVLFAQLLHAADEPVCTENAIRVDEVPEHLLSKAAFCLKTSDDGHRLVALIAQGDDEIDYVAVSRLTRRDAGLTG